MLRPPSPTATARFRLTNRKTGIPPWTYNSPDTEHSFTWAKKY